MRQNVDRVKWNGQSRQTVATRLRFCTGAVEMTRNLRTKRCRVCCAPTRLPRLKAAGQRARQHTSGQAPPCIETRSVAD